MHRYDVEEILLIVDTLLLQALTIALLDFALLLETQIWGMIQIGCILKSFLNYRGITK